MPARRRVNARLKPPTTAVQDPPDLRDWSFTPSLRQLRRSIPAPSKLHVLDQGQEGACTGFGLAAVINLLNRQRGGRTLVSARMLYEMARLHDEWPGEQYPGSSCRGAIKGWANMGVCSESSWPYRSDKPGELTVKRAKDARTNTLGAYYRVQPRIADFHAAINEGGAVFCTAKTHGGWLRAARSTGTIPLYKDDRGGGHAFAVVGYTSKGFWIQNSWGASWGKGGLGLWQYEDWLENLMDAWVVALALPTPQIWHLPPAAERNRSGLSSQPTPQRSEIAGHFIHIDDGRFHDHGRYWSNAADVRATARLVAGSGDRYQHLLLYAHGGLNSPKDSARRIAAMKETFKRNAIYPYHFMYDTGILEELKDVILRREAATAERATALSDWTDRLLERTTRVPGRALWREMKDGARRPFLPRQAGAEALAIWMTELARKRSTNLKVHLCGHSTGAILLARLLEGLEDVVPSLRIASCTLFGPAATVDLFETHYFPYLVSEPEALGIEQMRVFNLNDRLERADTVAKIYRKSLLYLVAQAFEERVPEAILGRQTDMDELLQKPKMSMIANRFAVHYSDGSPDAATQSTQHSGFDNDVATMNSLLRTILGREPAPEDAFTREILDY